MRILHLDIETAPNLVHVWGLYDVNVAINQIMASGYVMCFAAKWHGTRGVMFDSMVESSHKAMVKRAHALLDEADVVVHYNGTKFDIPTLSKEFAKYGLLPPSPYKQVDLLRVVKRQFRFPSNKLDYIAQQLGLGSKVDHPGHSLWVSCMNKDEKAWRLMKRYNKQDVVLLERLYDRLLPWIPNHPNRALYEATDKIVCPSCGSAHLQRRGEARTVHCVYARYQCNDCGSWLRSALKERSKPALSRHAA